MGRVKLQASTYYYLYGTPDEGSLGRAASHGCIRMAWVAPAYTRLRRGTPPAGAEVRTQAAWGQGERGAAGAADSGSSEIFYYDAELEAARVEPNATEDPGPEQKEKS